VRQCAAMLRRYGQPAGSERIIAQMEDEYGTQTVRAVLGDGIKRLAPSERDNYGRTNRSLHFLRALKKGETIAADDIGVLRTEKVLTPGISPAYLQTVVGATMTRDAPNGAGVQWEDILCRG
ncbi:MAG: spore coat protein, partial [Treponemataceae bacterium]|nr:spore coat protein [Treponemataceae bacterium]